MSATYTPSDALWTLVIFVLWIAFFGVGIWLLIRLFRNENFIRDRRDLSLVIKVIVAVFTLFVPVLGVLVLVIIEVSTRSPGKPAVPLSSSVATDTPHAHPTTSSADEATYAPRPPFPPPSGPEDTRRA